MGKSVTSNKKCLLLDSKNQSNYSNHPANLLNVNNFDILIFKTQSSYFKEKPILQEMT